MILNGILAALAILSLLLTLWQWIVARRFPLHQRQKTDSFPPALTLLKPLKGCDEFTEACLRSWFEQDYTGRVQILFGVSSGEDSVCEVVRKLIASHSNLDAKLVICGEPSGANAKVSKLALLEKSAKHEIIIISDADVRVPPDLLSNVVAPLREPACGLVTCFYRLANPSTAAMRWEAVAINADFWSQVLQAQSLKPIDFALGAVMATRRAELKEIGGFASLENCLADDYQLGHCIAAKGQGISISPIVVECWSSPMGWKAVWKHQLRWARTIRVCQPVPYFFSILGNATLWPVLWLACGSAKGTALIFCAFCLLVRIITGIDLQWRLSKNSSSTIGYPSSSIAFVWLIPLKDLLQTAIWFLAFLGNRIEWRGQRLRLRRDGTLFRD